MLSSQPCSNLYGNTPYFHFDSEAVMSVISIIVALLCLGAGAVTYALVRRSPPEVLQQPISRELVTLLRMARSVADHRKAIAYTFLTVVVALTALSFTY